MMVRFIITLITVCLAWPALAHQTSNRLDVGGMAAQSDLVFKGRVVGIDYRESEGKGEQKPLPFTFVTYAIEEVLFGQYSESTLTLRFLGGMTKSGEIMMNTSAPSFDMGDEDILFVQDNGRSECPLVECSNGRLRVIHGAIYNEYGQAVLQDRKGGMVLGRSENLDEVNTYQIGERKFQRNINRKLVQEGDGEASTSKAMAGIQLQAGNISGLVREHIFKANARDPYGMSKQVRNLDMTAPITAPQARPVALPEPKSQAQAPTNEDPAELEAIQHNGGNPVLKDQ
ncbi:hypothetical protein BTA51_04130 [Hahella sp. CCB-MM4]|uniref:hypothetical protein n=1 Tax=Hahella sp. (strain CCB-MM4) TaxID=1926491 RepID=UPI000B9A4854|nr:hypothetical protein [Hahella sp. CCB-MM4]OZG74214.1 hypothetical protein BTA51_04130 [Hahella sp. CCB-MM4]